MQHTLPKSYEDINYKTYVKIIQSIPAERPEGFDDFDWSRLVHFTYLSAFLKCDFAYLESLPASEILAMIQTLSFMDEPFNEGKTTIHVKTMDELTFDNFVNFQKLASDQWNNLGDILLSCTTATPEQVDNMSIAEAMTVFFCLNKETRKYLRHTKYSLLLRLGKQTLKKLITRKS